MDADNIYKGIGDVDLGEKLIQLQEENGKLLEHVKKLQDDVEKLCQEIIKMKKEKDAVSQNISELFNTAKREIDRKNETINQLREELDDLYFRRHRAPNNGLSAVKCNLNLTNEPKCEMSKDKSSNSKSPLCPEKAKTKSKTPDRHRSRSSSFSKSHHKLAHKRGYDKIRSPNRYRSKSRSPHWSKRRRRSSSPGNHREISRRGSRRSRSREYHSRGRKREDHHFSNAMHKEKKQDIRNINYKLKSEQSIDRSIKEENTSKKKHYLVKEFEDIYNEDIDTEADPSPFSNRAPFKSDPQTLNQNKIDNSEAHSVLTEIYNKSESLVKQDNSRIVEDILKTLKKDYNTNCSQTPLSSEQIDAESSSSVNVDNTKPKDSTIYQDKDENVPNSGAEPLKDTENLDCSTSLTPLQTTQQSVGRRRRRCVLKIKE